MFEKNMILSFLLDFYSEVLDEHTRNIMNAYYCDDLSLAEIAEGVGISRQGIRHVIKRGEEQLEFLEAKLGLAKRHEHIYAATEKLEGVREALLARGAISDAESAEIAKAIEMILGKGV